eukprot:3050891-Lingulodinium_polyedra.AAC.1
MTRPPTSCVAHPQSRWRTRKRHSSASGRSGWPRSSGGGASPPGPPRWPTRSWPTAQCRRPSPGDEERCAR